MNTGASSKRSPLIFFVLVFVISIPFWVLSTMVKVEGLPDNLPVTDIGAVFAPTIAASILVYREEKLGGVKRLLKRAFDYKRIKQNIWYVPIIFLPPLLYLLTYEVMRLIGLPLPAEWHIPLLTPIVFVFFFIGAAAEELGYMGYAIDPMQDRWSALTASIIMGSLWAIWHYPSMIQVGQTPMLMAWGTLGTVGFRILYVWLYNNTGKSIFGIILFHAMSNTGRSVFPGGRSYYELADGAVGYSIIAITAVIVAFLWGSKTLALYRFGKAIAEGKES
ncbi:CAAX prenyl protease 2 [uncultured archaeon]|nr:CAAX prenyl protease 2 [uncultured archaeon]